MFSEFLLVFMTFIGVGLVGDYSIILGLFIFSVLTYLCACNCLKESVGETVNGETESRFHFVHQYISTVGNAIRRSICAIRWSYILVQIRRVLYILKVIKESNIEQSESQFVEAERFQQLYPQQSSQGCSTPHSVDAEIKTMVDCILREYIKWWYHNKISPNTQFTSEVNCIIYETLTAFCNGLSTVKRKTLCCHFIQLYLHFFFHFKEALNKVNFEQQNILEVCISKKKEILENFKMRHWAMKDKMTEWFYLQSMMTSLIDLYGPTEILSCPILHSVLVEILTRTLMYSLVNTLSDPDRINSWILKLLQNVLKNESESLVHFINTSNKAASNTADDIATDSPNFKKPVILLSSDDTSVAAQNTCVSIDDYSIANEHSNISSSSSKFLDLSTEKVSDLSMDIDYTISDISQNSSQGIVDSAITNSDQQCLLFEGREVKVINSQNLSNKSLNFQELKVSESSDFLEVARLKRSKSADYIRQMSNTVSLYPLNRQSGSIKVHNKKNKSPMLARLVKTSHSCDVEIAEEAVEKELPPLFTDVKIIETQQQESAGHTPYTLYCIQYLGMFQSIPHAEAAPILVRQTVNIKRRFKEFLALQLRLEDDPSLKRCLKGIKGPSKWQATPFTHLDKKNVAERKTFLEKYLQDLCKQDEISKSSELQEFLAYGGDASIAFVRKSFDITVPRIDKMIARSVKGAIGLFRTALPTPTTEAAVAGEFNSQESELEVIPDESSEYDFQVYLVDFSVCDPEILQEIDFLITNFDDYLPSESSYYDNRVPNIHKPILYHSISISDHDSCSCMDIETMIGSLREENHLANVIIDFAVESLHRLPGPNTTSHIHLVKFLCGSILDNFITTKLDEVNEDKCARLLHSFHKALWPEDKLGSKKGNKVPDLPAILVKIITTCHKDLPKVKWIGQIVSYILRPGEISNAIEMIIGSLQNESLNRCFLFYALDTVCQALCSQDK